MAYRTTPRMAQRKATRHRRFLETATRLFGERGYHATTVPMIVEAAGSSTGSFYFYFENKEDVFVAVLKAVGEALSEHLNQRIEGRGGAREQLTAAVEGLFLFLAERPEAARILITESASLGGRIAETRRTILDSHTRGVAQALAAAAPARRATAEVLAWCWVGAVHEAVTQWLRTPPEERAPAAGIARSVAGFNLRGVGLEA